MICPLCDITKGRHSFPPWLYHHHHLCFSEVGGHLVELQQQGGAGPAGEVEGLQEDAEQPGGAAHQGGQRPPQALLLIVERAAGGPV